MSGRLVVTWAAIVLAASVVSFGLGWFAHEDRERTNERRKAGRLLTAGRRSVDVSPLGRLRRITERMKAISR